MAWVTPEPERLQPGAQQQGGEPLLAPHHPGGPARASASLGRAPSVPKLSFHKHAPLRTRDLCLLGQEEAENRMVVGMMQRPAEKTN